MLLDFAGAGNPLGAQGTIVPKPTSVLQVKRCIFRVFKEQCLHIGSTKGKPSSCVVSVVGPKVVAQPGWGALERVTGSLWVVCGSGLVCEV